MMGGYQLFLWESLEKYIHMLSKEAKVLARVVQPETVCLLKQQVSVCKHSSEVAACTMASRVVLRQYLWLWSTHYPWFLGTHRGSEQPCFQRTQVNFYQILQKASKQFIVSVFMLWPLSRPKKCSIASTRKNILYYGPQRQFQQQLQYPLCPYFVQGSVYGMCKSAPCACFPLQKDLRQQHLQLLKL